MDLKKEAWLKFNIPLGNYFALARLSPNEQKDPAIVTQTLAVDHDKAMDLITKVGLVRSHFSALQDDSDLRKNLMPGTKAERDYELRDYDVNNLLLMSNLGLISGPAVGVLAKVMFEAGIKPGNLDLNVARDLVQLKSLKAKGVGGSIMYEISRLLKTIRSEPDLAMDLKLKVHPKQIENIRRSLQKDFQPRAIEELFSHVASASLTRAARTYLKHEKHRGRAIAAVLGHFAM